MSNEINRVPPGIMSLLDMKARGQLPRFLADVVAPTFDFSLWYTNAVREPRVGQAGPINAAGSWLDVSAPQQTLVPQDEIWFVHRVTCRPTAAFNGAGGAIVYAPLLRIGQNGRIYKMGNSAPFVWGNTDRPAVSASEPFLMLGGDQLGVFAERYTAFAVNPDIIIEALVTRLRV